MKKSTLFLLLTVFLFSISTVSALRIAYDAIQEEVLPGQVAKYTIHLTNNNPTTETITIKSIDLAWQMDKDSTSYEVKPGKTQDIIVTFTPLSSHPTPSLYGVNFQAVTSNTKETKLIPVRVVAYTDTISASFTSLPVIDPRRSTIAKLLVKNKHNILLENIDVKLQSEFFTLNQKVTLQGNEQKELEYAITLNPETIEGEYTLTTLATYKNNELLNQETLSTIGKYSDTREVIEPAQQFLLNGETITQTNDGDSVVTANTHRNFNSLAYKFTDFNPKPTSTIKIDSTYTVEWQTPLRPGESASISYQTNYRQPLLILILLVAVVVGIYYLRKRHLDVTKKVLLLHTKEGGLAIMKVLVSVKNAGSITIKDVHVMDRIPNTLKAPTDFGSHKPSSIKNAGDGMRIIWNIPYLRVGEEKVLSYKIESKMNLNGKTILPPALAKFMTGNKKILASSQAVSVSSKQ